MMYRQSLFARLYSSFGQQRKLFLLVFLWTCLCLLLFKSSLFNAGAQRNQPDSSTRSADWTEELSSPMSLSRQLGEKLHARSAAAALRVGQVNLDLAGSSSSAAYLAAGSLERVVVESDTADKADQPNKSASNANIASQTDKLDRQTNGVGGESSSSKSAKKKQADSTTSAKHVIQPSELPVAGSECHYDYPNLFDLQFNNIHWQRMSTKPKTASSAENATKSANYYLYNAYYDDRWRAGVPSVRILAMIDRVDPPPTNCLFWSSKLRAKPSAKSASKSQHNSNQKPPPQGALVPLITRASFVYAWYPKWGNYKDGILQPWIVTCPMVRSHIGLVPDSVSLVEVPDELEISSTVPAELNGLYVREKRESSQLAPTDQQQQQQVASIAMPPSFSSSSPSVSPPAHSVGHSKQAPLSQAASLKYDCKQTVPITNNLPVFNQRPAVKEKFAVCVKGLDFPHEDVSVRLVEWIELLNLLGAGKIFLYNLDVHENTSKVLHYYQKRGMVELSPLTLPGDQPNLPEYQHLYLKSKLTAKRQNELIPYNDCLYRNLNSYQYLALLDIDEIIMPLKHHNWYSLMEEVEELSLSEQNYSRASYNVRNVYFFDDLAGPLGTTSSSSSQPTNSDPMDADNNNSGGYEAPNQAQQVDSLELGIPHYLHMMQHVYRSKNYTKPGQYVKCFHNTERVVSLHNHFPMHCFGQCTTYSIPVDLAHLQHYRKDCVGPLKQSCKNDFRVFTMRDTTIWKYKQQMIRRTTRVLNHLNLLKPDPLKLDLQRQAYLER